MHRFYLAEPLQPAGADQTVAGEAAHRIARVLRLGPGDRVRLFDGSGREAEGAIAHVTSRDVTIALIAELPSEPDRPRIHLYQALIRPNRFEWLLEKATELGAASITPVISARCQVRAAELGSSRVDRWQRLIIEAAEQCGRRDLPRLATPAPWARALADAPGRLIIAWEDARRSAPPLGALLRDLTPDHNREASGPPVTIDAAAGDQTRPNGGRQARESPPLSLLIGPEGGFTEEEVEAARHGGAVIASLGPLVLRAETAAIAALAIAVDALS